MQGSDWIEAQCFRTSSHQDIVVPDLYLAGCIGNPHMDLEGLPAPPTNIDCTIKTRPSDIIAIAQFPNIINTYTQNCCVRRCAELHDVDRVRCLADHIEADTIIDIRLGSCQSFARIGGATSCTRSPSCIIAAGDLLILHDQSGAGRPLRQIATLEAVTKKDGTLGDRRRCLRSS